MASVLAIAKGVTSDPEIFRTAKLLVGQHGEDAPLRAGERADELLEGGDMIGAATWRRILAAMRLPIVYSK